MLTITPKQYDAFSAEHRVGFVGRLRQSLTAKYPSLSATRPELFTVAALTRATEAVEKAGFHEEPHIAAFVAFSVEEHRGDIERMLKHPAFATPPPPPPGSPALTEELRFRNVFPALAGMDESPGTAFKPLLFGAPVHAKAG